ncbi:TPA: hypothetical protein DCG86_06330 [Candidatus Marinimicrobia bacterium]|nr:hypothetical protein [Candidatus Neomarinimicrobiota bacterium]HBY19400.1 hypothetical protein [Candidatus Neomarinimicrobiota bacterium]
MKVVTRAYKEQISSAPNDLVLLGTEELIDHLEKEFTNMEWTPRIRFGGLPDRNTLFPGT